MTIPRQQPFYCSAAWSLLQAFAADKAAYRAANPEGFVIQHNFLDDLRKYLMYLMLSPHAGNYDEEAMQYDPANFSIQYGSSPTSRVPDGFWAGQKIVTTLDKSHGMGTYDPLTGQWSGEWIWWTNNRNFTELILDSETGAPFLSPPTYYDDNGIACSKIHPDTWVSGQSYSADAKVSYLTGWKAKREVVNKTLPPPQNPDDWEADTLWDDTNINWSLAMNKNKLSTADYFTNCKIIHSNSIVEDGEIAFEAIQNAAASAFFPKQVNPRTKFKPLIFFTSETQSAQFREKVSCSTAEVNNVATLGARFSSESLIDWYYGTNMVHMKRVDGNGVLASVAANKSTSCPCNQYAIEGCEPYHNSPINSSDWFYNDKCVGGGIINYLEMVLNSGVFSMLSTSIAENWATAYGDTTNLPATVNYNSELHGCHESGSEFFLKNLGQFDYYLDNVTPYVPSSLIEVATAQDADPIPSSIADLLSVDLLLTKWDAKPYGTFRRTWKHTLGRVSPWMRSQEMSTPPRDAWNPVFEFWLDPEQTIWYARDASVTNNAVMTPQYSGINYDSDAKWFGKGRINAVPAVTVFDNKCKAISALELSAIGWIAQVPYKKNVFVSDAGDIYYAKADIVDLTTAPHSNLTEWSIVTNYTCTVAEDITADLQIGWMVKLAPATNSLISDCTPAYVLSCKYDATLEKTILLLSKPISTNGYIHWNKEISQRHDGINASWGDNPEDCNIYYYPQAELLLGLFTTIQNVRYRQVSPSVERKNFVGEGVSGMWSYSPVGDRLGYAQGHFFDFMKFDAESIDSGYSFNEQHEAYNGGIDSWFASGNWGYAGNVSPYIHIEGSVGHHPYDDPVYHDAAATFNYYCFALKATWAEKLKNLPSTINIDLLVTDSVGYIGNPPEITPYVFPQACGSPSGTITSTVIHSGTPTTKRVSCSLAITDSWYIIKPNKLSQRHTYTADEYGYYFQGDAAVEMTVNISALNVLIPIEPDDAPNTIWDTCRLYHIDCPPDFTEDTKAPLPNPAQYSYKPMGYIAFTPPVGYAGEAGYEHPEMELVCRAVIGLGNDIEGNNPTEYRSVCIEDVAAYNPETQYVLNAKCLGSDELKYISIAADENGFNIGHNPVSSPTWWQSLGVGNFTTEYNVNPVTISHLADITIPTLTIDTQITIEDGVTPLPLSRPAGYDNDDVIWYKSAGEDCLMKVCSSEAGSGYMNLETLGDMQSYTYAGLKVAYNLTKAYSAAMWAASSYKDLRFTAQTRDSIGNETDLGEECLILEPPEYPEDTVAAFIENGS